MFECHNIPISKLYTKIFTKIVKHKKFLGLVVISEALKNIIINEFKEELYDVKILVAHDGADLERFEKLPTKSIAREELGIDQNKKIIGYVGHLYSGRGIEIIMQLAKLNHSYCFYLIGGNSQDIQMHKSQCENENIKNISFLGFLSQTEIMNYWPIFDVLLMPYQKKVAVGKGKLNTSDYMSPLKMFEYLASNVPFVSSDLPVLREALADGVNCFLVEADNVNQWNGALREIISSSDIRDKVIMNQKSTVKDYSWKKRAQKISRFINQKINESV